VAILRNLSALGHTYEDLGETFGISGVSVSDIVNRRSWKHVE
jgi:hypothetical protein